MSDSQEQMPKTEAKTSRRPLILDYFTPGFEPLNQLLGAKGLIWRFWQWIENAVVIGALAVMVWFPMVEIFIRLANDFSAWLVSKHLLAKAWHWRSISGSTAFVQHGTLVVGLIGAAIASREDRLLSLATGALLPKGWPQTVSRIFSATVGGVIAVLLCVAGWRFVEVERPAGKIIAYGIPVWVMELLLPVGFGLIALRVLYHSSAKWKLRWIAPLAMAILLLLFYRVPVNEPAKLTIPAFVVLGLATVLGAPIFVILGGSALILFWTDTGNVNSIPLDHYSLVTHAALPSIPLFTLAGYFLAEGGASKRLIRVFQGLFGPIRGGPAIVTALLCAFFTSFTGASGVTILALGGVVMPILLSAKYSERSALGLLTGAGSLGMLFPPCLPLMLYAIIASEPINNIFLGALIPGVVLVVMTAVLGIWMGPKNPGEERPKFDLREALRAIWEAKWELMMPVVALAGLLFGLATPVEAAAITALYAFIIQAVVWRDLKIFSDVPRVVVECGLVIGGVLLILGLAQGFTNYLVQAEIPTTAKDWVAGTIHSRYLFLLLLNLFLLVVGGLMDIYPAIVIIVPLMVPMAQRFGINPIHLGIIFLANLEMGFMMPPLGMNLLLSSYRFKKPMAEVCRSILPILAVQFIGVLLITYVPPLTTWLPEHFGEKTHAPAQIEDK